MKVRLAKRHAGPNTLSVAPPLVLDGDRYTPVQIEFMLAMDKYKRLHHHPYPDCRDVLRVAYALGYRQVQAPAPP